MNDMPESAAKIQGPVSYYSSQQYLSRTVTGLMSGICMPPFLPGHGPDILEAQVRDAIGYLPAVRSISELP